MKKTLLLLCLITLTGCGKLTQLYDTSLDTVKKQQEINNKIIEKLDNIPTQNSNQPATQPPAPQIIIVTPPPTIIIINPASQPKKSTDLKIVRDNQYDMTLYWSDVNAQSYTVYQNFYSLKLESKWVKVATFTGFSMSFAHVYEHGTHHYRVDANFEDGVTKTSIITYTGQEPIGF